MRGEAAGTHPRHKLSKTQGSRKRIARSKRSGQRWSRRFSFLTCQRGQGADLGCAPLLGNVKSSVAAKRAWRSHPTCTARSHQALGWPGGALPGHAEPVLQSQASHRDAEFPNYNDCQRRGVPAADRAAREKRDGNRKVQ